MLTRILEHVRKSAPHAEIQKRVGKCFADCSAMPSEQAAADAAIAAFDDSPEANAAWQHNRKIDAAKAIIDNPQTAEHYVSLAMAEITRQSIQAVKKAIRGKVSQTPDVDLATLKAAAKQVLDSLKVN